MSMAEYMAWQRAVACFYAECEGITVLEAVDIIAPDFALIYR